MPELESRREPDPGRIGRRLKTIPSYVVLLLVTTAAFPLLAVAALLLDAVRSLARGRPFIATRLLLFGWVYLATEFVVIVVGAAQWLLSGGPFGLGSARLQAWTRGLQRWWGHTLFATLAVLLRLRFETEGLEAVQPGPAVFLFRHASIIDTLLPFEFITVRSGVQLRWVMKKELLSDPALDIGGNRLPNYFVDRRSRKPREEAAAIRALSRNLGQDEGILIFPEGTRFTPEKQRAALKRLQRREPELYDLAVRYRRVLPPKLGGTIGLLDSGYDVVVCAHGGLEGLADLGAIWRGEAVGRTVRLRFWRAPASQIPAGAEERKRWLFELWGRVDEAADELAPALP